MLKVEAAVRRIRREEVSTSDVFREDSDEYVALKAIVKSLSDQK